MSVRDRVIQAERPLVFQGCGTELRMTIRSERSDIPDFGGSGVRRDLRMACRAAGIGDDGQPHLAAMLHVALRATQAGIGVRRVDELSRMSGAIVALLTGLIGYAAERFGMAGLAALLKQRVSFGERPAVRSSRVA